MTIHNLGSINIDLVYRVPNIVNPGETILSHDISRGLGGKGANTSIAIAKSGVVPKHYGAIGRDDDWVQQELADYGVDCEGVLQLSDPTGHAIIQVGDDGENAIILLKGANWAFDAHVADRMVARAKDGDILVLQNETAHVVHAAQAAKQAGLFVAYAAAPFDPDATKAILGHVDLLALNEIEAAQLVDATHTRLEDMAPKMVLVTKGPAGAVLYLKGQPAMSQPAFKIDDVIDTTAAGDTFFGYFLAGLERGNAIPDALKTASAAAALTVTKVGAADAIPTMAEVKAFMGNAA